MEARHSKTAARSSRALRVRGLLVPDSWDEHGAITGLALLTGDEEKYLIRPAESLALLLPALRQTIELEGILTVEKGEKLFFYQAPPSLVND